MVLLRGEFEYMLVRDWMSSRPITVEADDSVENAINIMKERSLRHLPVTMKGKLVGMLSEVDLKRVSAAETKNLDIHELIYLLSKTRVRSLMTKTPIFITEDYSIEEAADLMLEKKVRALPVVAKDGILIGLLTQTDIFRVLVSVMGPVEGGMLFFLRIHDKPGAMKAVLETIRSFGGWIVSVFTSYSGAPEGYCHLHIRARRIEHERFDDLKVALREVAEPLYIVDRQEGKREVWEAE